MLRKCQELFKHLTYLIYLILFWEVGIKIALFHSRMEGGAERSGNLLRSTERGREEAMLGTQAAGPRRPHSPRLCCVALLAQAGMAKTPLAQGTPSL